MLRQTSHRRGKWLGRLLLFLVLLVGILALGARIYIASFVRRQSQELVRQHFGPGAQLDEVQLSLLGTSISLQGFSLPPAPEAQGETSFSFETLRVDLGSLRRLMDGQPVLSEVTVTRPELVITTGAGQRINLAEVFSALRTVESSELPPMMLEQGVVEGGTLIWRDTRFASPLETEIERIEMTVSDLQFPLVPDERAAEVEIAGLIEGEAPLTASIAAQTLQPGGEVDSDLSLQIADLDVALLEPLFHPRSPLEFTEGRVTVDAEGTCRDGRLDLTLNLRLIGLEVRERGYSSQRAEFLGVPVAEAVALFRSDLAQGPIPIHIGGDLSQRRFDLVDTLAEGVRSGLGSHLQALQDEASHSAARGID